MQYIQALSRRASLEPTRVSSQVPSPPFLAIHKKEFAHYIGTDYGANCTRVSTVLTKDCSSHNTSRHHNSTLFLSTHFLVLPMKKHILLKSSENADSVYFIASKLLKSVSQGASTTCYVALSPQVEGVGGKYFADCNESNCSALGNDGGEALKLWEHTRAFFHRRLLLLLLQPTTTSTSFSSTR
ncbi:unnamed protein product [Linum tenue]|uniref:Uncharacterized protein n=1 Tax=Linum tenue TaxID=586396 RepID=A0AAV0QPK5_9ROSI|nr:unnamed protein product [Linum tenue]